MRGDEKEKEKTLRGGKLPENWKIEIVVHESWYEL